MRARVCVHVRTLTLLTSLSFSLRASLSAMRFLRSSSSFRAFTVSDRNLSSFRIFRIFLRPFGVPLSLPLPDPDPGPIPARHPDRAPYNSDRHAAARPRHALHRRQRDANCRTAAPYAAGAVQRAADTHAGEHGRGAIGRLAPNRNPRPSNARRHTSHVTRPRHNNLNACWCCWATVGLPTFRHCHSLGCHSNRPREEPFV